MHLHIFQDSIGNENFNMAAFNNAVEDANKYFSPICFSFGICEIDTMENYNFNKLNLEDELDPLFSNHTIANRLNIFIIDSLVVDGDDAPCGLGGGNRIILQRNCYGALTHELGHVFGLAHTFEGDELVDGSDCETAGDGICDTPADPYFNNRLFSGLEIVNLYMREQTLMDNFTNLTLEISCLIMDAIVALRAANT